jgi:hypothetical protein
MNELKLRSVLLSLVSFRKDMNTSQTSDSLQKIWRHLRLLRLAAVKFDEGAPTFRRNVSVDLY